VWLHTLNLASGSTAASPTPGVNNFTRKGRGLGHVIVFTMKPRPLNFANESTMANGAIKQGLKNPLKRVWCRSLDRCLNFNPFHISGGIRWRRWWEAGPAGYCASQDS